MTTKNETEPESESLSEPDSMQVVKPLTKQEKEKLAKLEAVIDVRLRSFFTVVVAMRTIKLEKLWRVDYHSWEDYVERKWRISRQHSYRLLGADGIIEKVKTVTQGDTFESHLPTSERPYREIEEVLGKEATPEQVVGLLKQADTYTKNSREIEPGDIRRAAVELKLVAKPERIVFELKEEWGKIRDELAKVVKVLEKHDDLEKQTAQLQELLEKVKEAVRHCPAPPKPKKTEPKTGGKAKGSKPAQPKPRKAKK